MLAGALLLVVLAGAGVALQRTPNARLLRTWLWRFSFWVLAPVLVLTAFLTVELDEGLVRSLLAAGIANWLVLGVAYAYAIAATRERDLRGCLSLAGGFGNTGYLGIPLALLAFGRGGVADAVVYDRLAWIVPATAVTTALARTHGLRGDAAARGTRARAILLNPPLLALGVALALRWTGAPTPWLDPARSAAALLVGPTGFLLLGLSVPLGRAVLARHDLMAGIGAVAIRCVGGPLALLAVAAALDAEVPPVYLLLAGVPGAFHLLVLARVYDLRPELMRALVVGSSAAAVVLVALGATLWR
jgi:predicted permease